MKNGHNNLYVCINLLFYFKGHAERYDSLDLVYAPKRSKLPLEVVVTYFITHEGHNDLHGRFYLVYDLKKVKGQGDI